MRPQEQNTGKTTRKNKAPPERKEKEKGHEEDFKDNDDPGTGSDDEFRSGHSRPGSYRHQERSLKERSHQQQDPDSEQGRHQDPDGYFKPYQHHG